MTREELIADLKDRASRLGVKVKSNWIDDWQENAVWAVCGFGLGYIAHVVVTLLK